MLGSVSLLHEGKLYVNETVITMPQSIIMVLLLFTTV